MKALLVGGTGPTGPSLAKGLLNRGYDVTVFHRGTHESEDLAQVEHIHADPHFEETIREALGERRFDIVVAAYGRVKSLAVALGGRCDRFVAVTGNAAYPGCMDPAHCRPHGMRVLANERDEVFTDPNSATSPAMKFAAQVGAVEQEVLRMDADGAFSASIFRYPFVYGPRQHATSIESTFVRRVLDRRHPVILADGGLSIISMCAAENAAHCVLLGIDYGLQAGGEIFNCSDDERFTQRQWVEMIAEILGADLEVISVPDELAWPSRFMFPLGRRSGHAMVDNSKAKSLLGYSDIIRPADALKRTLDWLLADDTRLPVISDEVYQREDELIVRYSRAVADIKASMPEEPSEVFHPYPHPKQPGLVTDHRGR